MGSVSRPPYSIGTYIRKSRASCIADSTAVGKRRSRSLSPRQSRIDGPSWRAAATRSAAPDCGWLIDAGCDIPAYRIARHRALDLHDIIPVLRESRLPDIETGAVGFDDLNFASQERPLTAVRKDLRQTCGRS